MGDVVRLEDHRHDPVGASHHPAAQRTSPHPEPRPSLNDLIDQARRTRARAQWLQREAQLLTTEAHYLLQMQSQQTRARLRRPPRPAAG